VRIVFLGTPRAAVPSLESLLAAGHVVTLVVSQPDRPAGRSSRPVPPPVKECALLHGLPVVQPAKVRTDAFLEAVTSTRPDVLTVVAYGRILPPRVLDAAPRGAVNVHFSLLPRYRGAAPVQWALARGEVVTGVTTQSMSEGLDEGDILLRREVPIEEGEHSPELQERLSIVGAALLVDTLSRLEAGEVTPTPQDPAHATYAPLLRKQDGDVDLALTAREVEGRVRGFDPWPGAWAHRGGQRLRIVRARARSATAPPDPGRVLAFEEGALQVCCGGGTLLDVLAVQPEGRRTLTAREAVNGRVLRPGDRLEGRQPR
jgi:methionyl-tRNA formyltransferase